MKMRQYGFVSTLVIILITSSCVSKKKLTYLQFSPKADYNEIPFGDASSQGAPPSYKIMPYDILFIRVLTPDPQWSNLFNQSAVGAGGSMTEESASLIGYPVDVNGKIEIPFVGKIDVVGKTLSEVKLELDSVFKGYVTDASITLRLVNNFISIIGEVNSPGRYHLNKDRINIFEALSMAGDMNEYSNRQKVQLIRPSPYGPIIKEFSLTDRSILSSEFYYVMPNDIIYAIPMQGKANQLNINFFSLFLTTISTALVILRYFQTF